MDRKRKSESDHWSEWSKTKVPDRLEYWGDVKNEEHGRRVFVRILPDITMRDLKDFFNISYIDHIKLRNFNAIIQFKRPIDVTKALEMDGKYIKGIKINILEYKKPKPKFQYVPKDRNYRTGMTIEELIRDPKGMTRSESLESRVCHSSPDELDKNVVVSKQIRNDTSYGSSADSKSLVPLVTNHASVSFKTDGPIEYHNPLKSIYPQQQPANQMKLDDFQQMRRSHQPQHVLPHQPRRPPTNNSVRDLPNDIELTLKLVIEQGTVRNLSLIQIDDVIRYFDYIKSFMAQNIAQQQQLIEAREKTDISQRQSNKSRRSREAESYEPQVQNQTDNSRASSPLPDAASDAIKALRDIMRS